MYFTLLFLFMSSAYNINAANVVQSKSLKNSQCVLPEKVLNECAQLITATDDQLKKLYPWHVGLYRKKQNSEGTAPINVCSGTLVSDSVILTAAHCLAEDVGGSLRNISEYFVAAGNEYREMDDERDANYRQVRKINNVIIPPVYSGHISNFLGDIAIVELKEPFIITNVIKPACLSPELIDDDKVKGVGQTVGWGLTVASRHPDTRLNRIFVPYVNLSTCRREISQEFNKYLVNDKICGEFSNGATICATDNGGGLLYTAEDAHGILRWYLDGIASVSLISGGTCETKQYSTFTIVNKFMSLICQSIVSVSEK